MVVVDEHHALRRLYELKSWADYIEESLSSDQRYEKGKLEALKAFLGPESLDQLTRDAQRLTARFRAVLKEAEKKGSNGA